MKRVLAIFLVLLHLLNVVGFYGVFSQLEVINNKRVKSRLDEDVYAGSDAITLRIPLSLPYSTSQQNYERVDGKFNHQGEVYRLVKQKLYNDTLYIVCVKDRKGTVIKEAIEELALSLTDKPADARSSSKTSGLFVKDFETSATLEVQLQRIVLAIASPSYYNILYAFDILELKDHPPQS